jgi:CRISPR/Cas system CMR-associated protein Cmr5 small subunit
MADQTGAGLKGIVDGLKTTVADLEKKVKNLDTDGSKKVTQEMFNRLESKLENVITANNLKKSAPRNNNNNNNN